MPMLRVRTYRPVVDANRDGGGDFVDEVSIFYVAGENYLHLVPERWRPFVATMDAAELTKASNHPDGWESYIIEGFGWKNYHRQHGDLNYYYLPTLRRCEDGDYMYDPTQPEDIPF